MRRGLFGGRPDLAPDVDQVYKTDRWGKYQWSRHLEEEGRTKILVDDGQKKIHSFPKFAHEVFHRYYNGESQRLDKIRPEDQWAVRAHDELEQMPDFERLKRRCFGDRILAGEATRVFSESVMSEMPDPPPMQDPEPLRDQIKGLMKFLQDVQDPKTKQDIQNQIEQLKAEGKAAVEVAAQFNQSMDDTQLRGMLRTAVASASEAVDDLTDQLDAVSGWGTGEGTTTPSTIAPELKAKLAERIRKSTKLQLLAKEAGRMRRIAARKQRSKSNYCRSEVTDIECGNDLARLLPSELLKLGTNRKWEFFRGYTERSLLQYKLSGKEPQGKGPIVICIDQSGSMNGQKEIWSKAVALAMLQIATMQHRKARVIHFTGEVVRVDDWEPGKVDPLQLIISMEKFYNGSSTEFCPPMTSSMEAIESDEKLKKADVVFITDGQASVPKSFMEEWNKCKTKKEFTCYGIEIGAPSNGGPLHIMSDKVLTLNDIGDDAHVTDVVLDI